MSLDTYLRSRSDRCSGCGYHKAQGCHCEQTGAVTPGEWAVFTDAIRKVARDGEVHQRDMRPLIRGRIEPKHIGQAYTRAIREGLLTKIGHEESNDFAGKNAGRLEPKYRLERAA